MLITRFIDPEVHGRYGFMVYVRCGAEGTKPPPGETAARGSHDCATAGGRAGSCSGAPTVPPIPR